MTTEEFESVINRLTGVADYFHCELSQTKLMFYFDGLCDLAVDDVQRALTTCIKTCRFMPLVADIRQALGEDAENDSEKAWLAYKHLAHQQGGYASPCITDAALAETLMEIFGSWETACWTDLSPEMWAAKRKEFGRVYRLMRTRGLTGSRTLIGQCERSNREMGYSTTMPMQIDAPASAPRLLPGNTGDRQLQREASDEHRLKVERREAIQRALVEAIDRHHQTKSGGSD